MKIKTITTVAGINVIHFDGHAPHFYWLKNLSDSTLYVSAKPNPIAGADDIAELPAKGAVSIETDEGVVYILGAGKVEIYNTSSKICPFELTSTGSSGGGGGSVTVDSYLSDISTNPVQNKVITEALGTKVNIVDLPTALPANGGNADTVNNHTVNSDVPADLDNILDSKVNVAPNAGAHNAIYRGKNLGASVTDEQYAAIAAGTFEGLYIGDYWVIDGVNYRIAAFDYYLKTGSTAPLNTHHIVVVPDSVLYKAPMNETNTAEGGYVGSKMYTEGLEQAKTIIKTAFAGHVLKHEVNLVNSVYNGHPSGSAWCESEVELMNEQMVYGGGVLMPYGDGGIAFTNARVEKSQLPLFTYRPDLISNRLNFWLRDVVATYVFAYVSSSGSASFSAASSSFGVRPAFCVS